MHCQHHNTDKTRNLDLKEFCNQEISLPYFHQDIVGNIDFSFVHNSSTSANVPLSNRRAVKQRDSLFKRLFPIIRVFLEAPPSSDKSFKYSEFPEQSPPKVSCYCFFFAVVVIHIYFCVFIICSFRIYIYDDNTYWNLVTWGYVTVEWSDGKACLKYVVTLLTALSNTFWVDSRFVECCCEDEWRSGFAALSRVHRYKVPFVAL